MQHKTISELHEMLASKAITPVELVEESLNLAKKVEFLNCFNFINEEKALTQAKNAIFDPNNPLSCIPVAHKDLFCTENIQTTCSSKILEGFKPPYTATVVENLENAGCIAIAKTNMDEFAMGSSNETSYFGKVHNPWLKDHVPGGSSGGAAASVASGVVPFATGTDTGGSIRQPAALCNLTGLKPTYGRISRWGMIAFASSLDQAGPLAHNAKDCAIALDAMTGHDQKDTTSLAMEATKTVDSIDDFSSTKTLGVVKEFSGQLSPEMENAFQESIKTYQNLGYKIKEISLPNIKYSVPTYYVIAPAECSSNLSRFDGVRFGHRSEEVKNLEELYIKSRSEGFGNEVKRRILIGTYVLSAGYYDAYYKKAQQVRRLITEDFKNAFQECDLILTPTSPGTTFAFDSKGSKDPTELYLEDLFTIAANLAGIPAISIPQTFVNNLPTGHQLIAPHLNEELILQTAHHFQQDTDWHLKSPSMEDFYMTWEVVIGLETHVQLSTKTKLFSRASTSFGADPNTNVNLVDCGLPGVLPTVNKEAFYKAIRFGLAINATINQISHFDRKNYFYPDLPKGYQITQMDRPIVEGGQVEIELEGARKVINVTRAHLEEDAGKSIHDADPTNSLIDLNRAGTPLLEIVSEPEISSAKEAVAYMKALHQLITFLDVSDGNMSQGSMRCDANVSIRKKGDKELGTRTEIKNINSFRFIEKAINFEIKRQIKVLESGEKVVQETRLYDANKDETRPMRTKEFANDYRYFPEPDLLPVVINDDEIAEIKNTFPELPNEKKLRYLNELKLSVNDADILSSTKSLSTVFEKLIENGSDSSLAAKWLVGDISALLNKDQVELENSKLTTELIGELLNNISDNTISGKIAKEVLEECYASGESPNSIIESKGLKQITDAAELESMLKKIVDDNPEQVAQFQAGKDKLFGYFVGQAMKETKGKGNPEIINKILRELLAK